jgi:hypothetical protein
MYGPGYILSWDLVTWLAESREELQPLMHLPEDRMVSEMMKWGGKAEESWAGVENVYMYHYAPSERPETPGGAWDRDLGPDVILVSTELSLANFLVHGLKRIGVLGDVINYYFGNEVTGHDQSSQDSAHRPLST